MSRRENPFVLKKKNKFGGRFSHDNKSKKLRKGTFTYETSQVFKDEQKAAEKARIGSREAPKDYSKAASGPIKSGFNQKFKAGMKNYAYRKTIEEKSGQDVGTQSVVKSRYIYKGARAEVRYTKSAVRTIKRVATVAVNVGKRLFSVIKAISVAPGAVLGGILVLFIALICATVIATFGSFNSTENVIEVGGDGLSDAYLYVTELDADNGRSSDDGASCDVDGIMAVLIAKHGYITQETWDKGAIKSEVKQLYNKIYERGFEHSVSNYVKQYEKAVFKTTAEKDRYDKLLKDGIYTEMKTLGSPFVGKDWLSIVSSKYGWRIHPIYHDKRQHNALDIPFGMGMPVNSVMDGKVSGINSLAPGYGNHILIEKTTEVDGKSVTYTTLYAHLSEINVRTGQHVTMGQVIGKVGSTGASTGAHLHLELWKNGKILNPLFYCAEKDVKRLSNYKCSYE